RFNSATKSVRTLRTNVLRARRSTRSSCRKACACRKTTGLESRSHASSDLSIAATVNRIPRGDSRQRGGHGASSSSLADASSTATGTTASAEATDQSRSKPINQTTAVATASSETPAAIRRAHDWLDPLLTERAISESLSRCAARENQLARGRAGWQGRHG